MILYYFPNNQIKSNKYSGISANILSLEIDNFEFNVSPFIKYTKYKYSQLLQTPSSKNFALQKPTPLSLVSLNKTNADVSLSYTKRQHKRTRGG